MGVRARGTVHPEVRGRLHLCLLQGLLAEGLQNRLQPIDDQRHKASAVRTACYLIPAVANMCVLSLPGGAWASSDAWQLHRALVLSAGKVLPTRIG